MANYRAVANGNWSSGATWAGGAVPPNGEGHNIYSNNFTVTIDTNVDVALITNAAITASFVGGGTNASAGGGFDVTASGFTITGNLSATTNAARSTVVFSGASGTTLTVNGNVTGFHGSGNRGTISSTGGGSLTINGNVSTTSAGGYYTIAVFASAGQLNINGNISCVDGHPVSNLGINGNPAVFISTTASCTVNNATITGGNAGGFNSQTGIYSNSSGVLTLVNCIINAGAVSPAVVVTAATTIFSNNVIITATNGASAISASVVNAYGTFVYSANGTNPVGGARLILGTTPTNAYAQFALNGINANSFVRYYTADNSTVLNQAAPTDVRSGVAYGIGNSQTGRLTVPARGSVSLNVNYGPSMPFTATRSGTTATATLAYSYPLVAGDQITVTGASNTEWNSTYTIASVVSGTSVTFTVPNTHSATAGAGAAMQTTGTAVLDSAAVASAVWGAATRTLTSASGPTAAENASAVWGAATRTLTAGAGITAADVWSHSSRTVTGGTVDTLTNAPTVPTAAAIATAVWAAADKTGYSLTSAERTAIATAVEASLINENDGQAIVNAIVNAIGNTNLSQVALVAAIRSDLATELGRIDAAISSRLAGSAYTAPANSDVAAIKAKTDNLPASPAATGDIPSANISAIKAKTDALPAAPAAVSNIPTAAQNASATRSELSVELARVDQPISTRATPANIPTADITAIKAKTDAVNVDRINNTATLSQVGNLLAQANS